MNANSGKAEAKDEKREAICVEKLIILISIMIDSALVNLCPVLNSLGDDDLHNKSDWEFT